MIKVNGQRQMSTVEPEQIKEHMGECIKIHGSIYKIRKMSGFAFVLLRTRREVIQCVYSEEIATFPLQQLKEESCVIFTARVKAEERSRNGFELQLEAVDILSEPEEESPVVIHNKLVDATLETLLNYRPITLRNEKERAIFKIQEGVAAGFRGFLQKENFTEIHTPKIISAGAEGGANIFSLDYFGKQVYLAQSPQTYKQMMVSVYEKVFEIGPVFRAEKHDTSRHLNEYTSMDLEMGYIESFYDIMDMETRMLQYTFGYLIEHYSQELELLGANLPHLEEIPALTFREAKELISKTFKRKITDYEDFEPEEERLLCELIQKETNSEFVFVTHYPASKRPFYAMEDPEDKEVTLSFDLLYRGMEITTGGQRVHNYKEQVDKLRRKGMPVEEFESYLMMHKYGMPPHGGLGLGLERFTSRMLGQNNVRYATLFPRDINRVTP